MLKMIMILIGLLLLSACQENTGAAKSKVQGANLDTQGSYTTSQYTVPQKKFNTNDIYALSFEKEQSNFTLDGAGYDDTVSHKGKRSIHFGKDNDVLTIKQIPVQEGKWYVISGYMYVNSQPADVMRYYIEYMHNDKGIDIPNYPVVSISKARQWEEFILPVYIKKDLNVTHINLTFRDVGEMNAAAYASSDVWLDDITMHEAKDSSQLFGKTPPSEKQDFKGALVDVDSLGNFTLHEENGTKPFLPVIIYPGGNTNAWGKYKEKGFNTVVCTSIHEAREAVKLGMHWIWSLYDYGIYDGNKKGYQRFLREYREIRTNEKAVFNHLLYFYWDNETYLLFDSIKKFSDAIKRIDVDENNIRYRPFMMQLDFSTGNMNYSNTIFSLVDLQSGYANPMVFEDDDPQNYKGVKFKGNYDGEFANFAIFDHIPGVKIPKSVFVINSPFGDKHIENTIFAALARGGKGIAYWKDDGSQPKIETKVWWKDFDKTTEKLQKLLPLIRNPHWTDWNLSVSLRDDEDGMVVGTRDFAGQRCMIFASRSEKAEIVRFGTSGVEDGQEIRDYFTGESIGQWQENVFVHNVPARGDGVYCW